MTLRESDLHTLLDRLGLPFQSGQDERGRVRCRFTYVARSGEPLAMSAVLRGEILQLIVHGALPGAGSEALYWRLNELNQDSYVARVYERVERDGLEVSGGLHASALARPEVLPAELSILAESVAAARLGAVHNPELPERPEGQTMAQLERAVTGAGFRMETRRDGRLLVGRFATPDGAGFLVELFEGARRFLCLRAHPATPPRVSEDRATLQRLQQVNAGLAIGAIAIARGEGRVHYTMAHVLDWLGLDGPVLRYFVEGAGAAVQLAMTLAS